MDIMSDGIGGVIPQRDRGIAELQEEIATHNTQFEENELELETNVKEYNDKKNIVKNNIKNLINYRRYFISVNSPSRPFIKIINRNIEDRENEKRYLK